MNPILRLAVDWAIRDVLGPALLERYGDNVPTRVAVAAAARVFQLIEEGRAGDMETGKTLVLFALDEAIKEVQGVRE